MDINTADRLTSFRLLTAWTGDVSTSQVNSLNLWPSVMIPGIKSHTLNINLKEQKVVYKLKFKPRKSLKDLSILSKIEVGVWSLLGDTWMTVFKVDKVVVYNGKRRKELKNGIEFDSGRKGPNYKGT